MAELRDITVDQGTHFDPTFQIKNPDRSPFNLTGYTARMMVRLNYDDSKVWITLTTENGGLVIVPDKGQIKLLITPAHTRSIPAPPRSESIECVYDLEVTSPAGTETRVAYGSFSINREVTR